MHLRITTALAALSLFAVTATAHAQDPEAGDTGQWQQPNNGGQNNGGWGQQNGNNGQPPQGNGGWNNGQNNGQQNNGQWNNGNGQNNGNGNAAGNGNGWAQDNEHAGPPHGAGGNEGGEHAGSEETGELSQWTNADNHLGAVHHLGVGFFGVIDVPIGTTGMATTIPTVGAPTVGMRYWLNDLIGLEAAIGIGFDSGTFNTGGTSSGLGSAWGLAFHLALPLAIAHWKHFAFIAQPEIELGFSGGSVPGAASGNGDDDLINGFLFRVGGKLGGEIHMGFIGIPQLSLQAGIGLHLQYSSAGNDVCTDGTCSGHSTSSINTIGIHTSIEHNPWEWFTGSITAIYYL